MKNMREGKPYFETKLENMIATPKDEQSFLEFRDPLFNWEKHPNMSPEGKLEIKEDNFQVNFEWGESKDINAIRQPGVKNAKSQWATLKNFSISTNEGGLNINDLIPDEWAIIFKRDPYRWGVGGDTKLEEKTIIMSYDITTPEGIIVLCHEAGHANIFEKMTEEERKSYLKDREKFQTSFSYKLGPISNKVVDNIVKNERNAWAYAMRKLKPLLKSSIIKQDDIKNYIHHESLKTYSDATRSLIENGLIEDLESIK
ncbi:MAG: hypothetical protein V1684_01405 [bacterium]